MRQPVVQGGVLLAPGGTEVLDGEGVVGKGEWADEGDVACGIGDVEGEGVASHLRTEREGNGSCV